MTFIHTAGVAVNSAFIRRLSVMPLGLDLHHTRDRAYQDPNIEAPEFWGYVVAELDDGSLYELSAHKTVEAASKAMQDLISKIGESVPALFYDDGRKLQSFVPTVDAAA